MIEITVKEVVKAFDQETNVLDGVSFEINSGERVGLLGKNGAGKTTIFKILTGELTIDSGEVAIASGRKIGLISQIPHYPEGWTVEQVLHSAFAELDQIREKMSALEKAMASGATDAELHQYDQLLNRYTVGGGYETDHETDKICNGLDISHAMRETVFDRLSGGEKTRVNLARLLLEKTDILLLDEPTNHLDMKSVEWLEAYLHKFKGTVLTISHDRYFLDQVVDRIIELVDGKAAFYNGNYSFFVQEKQARLELQMRQYEKEQAKIEQLEKAAEKLSMWAFKGMDKTYRRVASMEKRIERMHTVEKPKTEKVLQARFESRDFFGDLVLEVKGLSKCFQDRTLFSDVALTVSGGERIALLGDNGTGKSTFLKILLGEEQPTSGRIKFGPSVRIGYLPQILCFDHPERTLLDTMLYETKCSVQAARDRLGSFLFQGEDVFKQVSALSGGEQMRLKLCILMEQKINLLILDEPTNHLDIPAREWIESAVEEYEGVLLFVSHDRYFVDRFATRIWELADGKIQDYPVNYQKFRAMREREAMQRPTAPVAVPKPKKEKPKGGSRDLEKQVARLEREIEKQEQAVAAFDPQITAASMDYQELSRLMEEKNAAEAALSVLYEQWEEASAALEEVTGC